MTLRLRYKSILKALLLWKVGDSEAKIALRTMHRSLGGWTPTENELKAIQALAKRSLNDAIHLTEYEDDKVSRLAAGVTFVGVFAGAIYNATHNEFIQLPSFAYNLYIVLFYCFVLMLLLSLWHILLAIYPRFFMPHSRKKKKYAEKAPLSFVFPPLIVKTSSGNWARAFSLSTDCALQRKYVINDICETYLVSKKVMIKLKYLKKATFLIATAFLFLLFWLSHIAITKLCQHDRSTSLDLAGTVIIVDAENVLWDSNTVLKIAYERMLRSVCTATGLPVPPDSLAYVRPLDLQIIATHQAGLYYPAELLVRVVSLNLMHNMSSSTTNFTRVSSSTIKDVTTQYKRDIMQLPAILPGAQQGLKELAKLGAKIVIVTEGRRKDCMSLLEQHGLLPIVSDVRTGEKNNIFFTQILDHVQPVKKVILIGDQLALDIKPAKDAGFVTVYRPGNNVLPWELVEEKVQSDYTITSFKEVFAIVCREGLLGHDH